MDWATDGARPHELPQAIQRHEQVSGEGVGTDLPARAEAAIEALRWNPACEPRYE